MTSELTALELAERVGELVRIPSVNPGHAGPVSGDDGERPMSAWMAERAADLGGNAERRRGLAARRLGDEHGLDALLLADVDE